MDSTGRTEPEALFRLVAESLPSGVLLVDSAGLIMLANQQIELQFGYTRDELIAQSIDMLLPASHRAAHAAHREGFMTMPRARPMGAGRDLFGRRRDGSEFPIEVGLRPMATEHGTFVLAVVVDLTARRHVEHTHSLTVEGQLEFERLVSGLSASFINLPADRVDDAMREALRRIGEARNLDRCTFFRIQPDSTAVTPVGLAETRDPSGAGAHLGQGAVPVGARDRSGWRAVVLLECR